MRPLTHITSIVVASLTLFAGVVGVAAAQDLRSPDARDSARQVTRILHAHAVGAPEVSVGRISTSVSQSKGHATNAPEVSVGRIATSVPQPLVPQIAPHALAQPGNGFSWGDAGIGAAGMLGLVAIFAGTFWLTTQRRRDRRVPVATS
jgi:hypothetical protein